MYILAFVTLMIALIGSYAQMYSAQMGRMAAKQSGISGEMLNWHATAVAYAENLVSQSSVLVRQFPTPIGGKECLLTYFSLYAPVPRCTYSGGNVYVGMPNPGSFFDCQGSSAQPCLPPMSPGWTHTFYSMYYTDNSNPPNYYVLTYVQPSTGGDTYNQGFLTLPGNIPGWVTQVQLAVTLNDLRREIIHNPQISPEAWGTVVDDGTGTGNTILKTPTFTSGQTTNLKYPIVDNAESNNLYIPINSIGLISLIKPCPATLCI